MTEPFIFDNRRPLRSSWPGDKLVVGKPLTDKVIENYWKRGYYSAELREARAELLAWKEAQREARRRRHSGN